MIITIDGPAGSGKSTIARTLADRLGWMFLDTGAMYRAVALAVQRRGLVADRIDEISRLTKASKIGFERRNSELRVFLDDEDVSDLVRTEAVSKFASEISAIAEVRSVLVYKQRELGVKYGNVVTEGRDQGSVVFPEAELKIYLDADVAERARRRYDQLISQGQSADFETIRRDVEIRDRRDRSRKASPLVVPDQAVVIDSTHLTPEQVLDRIIELVKERSRNT